MIEQTEIVRRRFDAEATQWDQRYQAESDSIYTANLLSRKRAATSFAAGIKGRVLDLACGAGNVALSIDQTPGARLFGADLSLEMLRRSRQNARTRHRTLRLLNADALNLPFVAGSFEGILCLGLLDYITAHLTLLKECHRVLRPGGRIIVSIPNARSPFVRIDDLGFGIKNAFTQSLPQGLRAWLKRELLGKQDDQHYAYRKHRYNPDIFAAQISRMGFQVSDRMYMTYGFGILNRSRLNKRFGQYLSSRCRHSLAVERTGWTQILQAIRLPQQSH